MARMNRVCNFSFSLLFLGALYRIGLELLGSASFFWVFPLFCVCL